jgi:hypothetical protein
MSCDWAEAGWHRRPRTGNGRRPDNQYWNGDSMYGCQIETTVLFCTPNRTKRILLMPVMTPCPPPAAKSVETAAVLPREDLAGHSWLIGLAKSSRKDWEAGPCLVGARRTCVFVRFLVRIHACACHTRVLLEWANGSVPKRLRPGFWPETGILRTSGIPVGFRSISGYGSHFAGRPEPEPTGTVRRRRKYCNYDSTL